MSGSDIDREDLKSIFFGVVFIVAFVAGCYFGASV